MIVSISRRCDIPRFRFDWFLEKLEAGFVDVANPYNAARIRRVSLKREDAEFLVFWTRDPAPLLAASPHLEAYPCYVMTTLTGYPETLEPNMPPVEAVIKAMRGLAEKWGNRRVIWRYDPVLLTSLTDLAFHYRNFAELAARLSGTTQRVIVSVYDEYSGARRRLSALERDGRLQVLPHYTAGGNLLPGPRILLAELARIAGDAGMEIQSCAEKEDLSNLGIKAGACVDGGLIREILYSLQGSYQGARLPEKRDKNQRPHCCCAPSVDIGSYGSCPAACAYCYARR